MKKKEGGLGRL